MDRDVSCYGTVMGGFLVEEKDGHFSYEISDYVEAH